MAHERITIDDSTKVPLAGLHSPEARTQFCLALFAGLGNSNAVVGKSNLPGLCRPCLSKGCLLTASIVNTTIITTMTTTDRTTPPRRLGAKDFLSLNHQVEQAKPFECTFFFPSCKLVMSSHPCQPFCLMVNKNRGTIGRV